MIKSFTKSWARSAGTGDSVLHLGVEGLDGAVLVGLELALLEHLLDEVVGLLLQFVILGLRGEGLVELQDLVSLFCKCLVQTSLLPFGFSHLKFGTLSL